MKRRTLSALVLLACAMALGAHADDMVTPTKVTADPMLDMGSEDSMTCGIHWVNLVASGNTVKAYELRIFGFGLPKTSQFITGAYGSLRTTQVLSNGDPGSHTDTKPDDLYLLVEGDPKTYRLIPTPDAIPPTSYGGMVDTGASVDQASDFSMALIKNKAIMVNYVFKRPDLRNGKETVIFRVSNNMSEDKQSALTDCFLRLWTRMKAANPVK